MREQIEGSQAVARDRRRVPPGGDLRLPDLAADAHRRRTLTAREVRCAEPVRVRQRGVRVRGDVGRDRRKRRPAPALHRDRQSGPAVHERSALQRLRSRTADRHDRRQPCDRRADQHLERPLRLDVAARLGLDPALRRVKPGGGRRARAGVPDRRGAVAAGDGLHGRLHPHARGRERRAPGTGRRSMHSCPPSSRASCSTRRIR